MLAPVPPALDRAALAAALGAARHGGVAVPVAGFAAARLHVLAGEGGGLAAALLGLAGGRVAWIWDGLASLPPWARLGLAAGRVLLVRTWNAAEALDAAAAALGATYAGGVALAAPPEEAMLRRLRLATEASGAMGFLLCPDAPLPCWRVRDVTASHPLADPRWEVRRDRDAPRLLTWRAAQGMLEEADVWREAG